MYIYIIGTLILVYFLFLNNNYIENFTLNFPENELKCKCNLEDERIEEPNNKIEQFTNYDNSKIIESKRLNRIYNIYKSPYNESAETYFNKNYNYPITPLSEINSIPASNEIRYKNIGNSNHKILGKEYEENENIGYYNFNL
jgi:hypothetical protein